MCGCMGKNFSGWIGSVAGACGFTSTVIDAGMNQSADVKVIDGNTQLVGVGMPGGGAVQPDAVPCGGVRLVGGLPGLKRPSADVTSVWPSVRMKIVTSAVGFLVNRIV